MPRVAAVDPGTVSFDLCVLHDGEPVVEEVIETGMASDNSERLVSTLARHGPYDLVYGPSGYGLPLVAAADVGERELAEMVLVRADQAHADTGVGGMRSLLRALAVSGLPVVFGPGVIHLASVPHPRWRRAGRRCARWPARRCGPCWSACRARTRSSSPVAWRDCRS